MPYQLSTINVSFSGYAGRAFRIRSCRPVYIVENPEDNLREECRWIWAVHRVLQILDYIGFGYNRVAVTDFNLVEDYVLRVLRGELCACRIMDSTALIV